VSDIVLSEEDQRVAANMKRLREASGVTRHEMGTAVHRSGVLVGAIERGVRRATPKVRRLAADRLRVPLDALTDDETAEKCLDALRRTVREPAA
jgi:transcriptional regulator with XRE-family HTH domain